MIPHHRSRPFPLRSVATALLLVLGCGSDADNRTLRITKDRLTTNPDLEAARLKRILEQTV